ncbi:MAG: response regulator [Desulfobacterales bacterium]|nr:response regulator [Desulfobacterales bacterium]MCP4163429.1 response regulator [Deltaproteobacteria bacterium]
MVTKTEEILIIEDEVQMRFYLMTLVKSMGLNPVLTKDGNEGLLKLSEIKPKGIILDVMMPDKGGALVYKELVTNPDLKNIPVVFFSGVDKSAFFHYIKMLNLKHLKKNETIPEPEYFVAKDADPEYLKEVVKRSINQNIS